MLIPFLQTSFLQALTNKQDEILASTENYLCLNDINRKIDAAVERLKSRERFFKQIITTTLNNSGPSSQTKSTDCETESPAYPTIIPPNRKEKPPCVSCDEIFRLQPTIDTPGLHGRAELACPPSEGLCPTGEEEEGNGEKEHWNNHKYKDKTIDEQVNTIVILHKDHDTPCEMPATKTPNARKYGGHQNPHRNPLQRTGRTVVLPEDNCCQRPATTTTPSARTEGRC